jgi:hypothetical protein
LGGIPVGGTGVSSDERRAARSCATPAFCVCSQRLAGHDTSATAITARADIATVAGKPTLRISFAGSAGVHPRNFNAPLAVTRAATLYTLRLLIDEGVPMNEGLVDAFELDIPAGLLDPPFTADATRCPPVVERENAGREWRGEYRSKLGCALDHRGGRRCSRAAPTCSSARRRRPTARSSTAT